MHSFPVFRCQDLSGIRIELIRYFLINTPPDSVHRPFRQKKEKNDSVHNILLALDIGPVSLQKGAHQPSTPTQPRRDDDYSMRSALQRAKVVCGTSANAILPRWLWPTIALDNGRGSPGRAEWPEVAAQGGAGAQIFPLTRSYYFAFITG